MEGQNASPVAEACPKLLEDTGVWLFFERGAGAEDTYIVGSISADRFLTVPAGKLPAIRAFMRRLDGRRSLDQIEDEILREHGWQLEAKSLFGKFRNAGLIAGHEAHATRDIQEMSTTFLRIPIDPTLSLLRKAGWMTAPLVSLGVALILSALALLAVDGTLLRLAMVPGRMDGSVLWSAGQGALIAFVSMIAHELSHCFAAAQWGIRNGTVRAQLYLGVIPIVALKLAGLYTLTPRGRLVVWSAGVFFNLAAASAALLLLRTALPGSTSLELTVTINWLLAALNLVPLLPTDGYFLLSTLTKDANVRVRAWDWVRRPFRAGRKLSLFVVVYIVSTVWLLVSTIIHLAWRVLDGGAKHLLWQSAGSLFLLSLLVVTLWRNLRRRGESL